MSKVETFFCHACLRDLPLSQQSDDTRYCKDCYKFLLKEAEMDITRGSGGWKPVRSRSLAPQDTIVSRLSCNKINAGVNHGVGRPRVEVPVEKVLGMQAQGMGLRDIAKELGVSHMTISRLLKRARQR